MNIALKQLKVFVTITKEKTITAAADKLFISKPAVSMALAELEKNIGNKLFDRHNNRLFINHQGRQLLPLADEILKRTQDLEALFAESNSEKGQLDIGCSETIGNQLIPYLLKSFQQDTNNQNQKVIIKNTADICQDIVEFKLDIGLVEGSITQNSLLATPWLKDEMCVICSPEHPLAQYELVSFADIDNHAWVLREDGSGTKDVFTHHLSKHLNHWTVAFELKNTSAIINFVSCGFGLSLLSKHAVQAAVNEGRIVALPMDSKTPRQLSLVYHKDKYQSPFIKRFIDYCLQWQP